MPSSYAIGEHFEAFIKNLIDSKRYMSASEVVRDALRLMEDRESRRKELISEIQKGIDHIETGQYYTLEEARDYVKANIERREAAKNTVTA